MKNQIVASYLVMFSENRFGQLYSAVRTCVRLEDGRHFIVHNEGKGDSYKAISTEDFIRFSNDMNLA